MKSSVAVANAESLPQKPETSELLISEGCRHILLRNLKRCLECGACESACERRHHEQRWHGEPIIVGKTGQHAVMPVCQGCADPACEKACPRQAIQPGETCPQIQEELCVGCGRCVLACPFGSIACLPAEQKDRPKTHAGNKRKRAAKCDGCADFSDRACIRECPTGALEVIDWKQFQKLQQQRSPFVAATLLQAIFRPGAG